MKISRLLGAAGAALKLSAGAALAAEGCECRKDVAAGAEMPCCDKMKAEAAPTEPTPAPLPSDAPTPQSPADQP